MIFLFAIFIAAGMGGAASPASRQASADRGASSFRTEYEKWRTKRLESLRSDSGWLTLVGLYWLQPGENTFGSDASSRVVLPRGKAPAHAGSFFLKDGKVRLAASSGSGVTLDGNAVSEKELRTDEAGEQDVLHLGDLMFYVIKRGDRFGVRIKDPNSSVRKQFKGIETFPPNPAYRIAGKFVPHTAPREIGIPTVLGTTEKMKSPGLVRFRLDGKDLALEPVVEDDENPVLFFIFRDGTSGVETYPAGRFLYAEMPKDGMVVVDFNRATNPPCAFTPYATCPLPPRQNWLAVRIEAGEKTWGEHASGVH